MIYEGSMDESALVVSQQVAAGCWIPSLPGVVNKIPDSDIRPPHCPTRASFQGRWLPLGGGGGRVGGWILVGPFVIYTAIFRPHPHPTGPLPPMSARELDALPMHFLDVYAQDHAWPPLLPLGPRWTRRNGFGLLGKIWKFEFPPPPFANRCQVGRMEHSMARFELFGRAPF